MTHAVTTAGATVRYLNTATLPSTLYPSSRSDLTQAGIRPPSASRPIGRSSFETSLVIHGFLRTASLPG